MTGTPDEPAKAGISVADIAAGMYAYTGILTALYERERTGAGTDAGGVHARGAGRVDEPAVLFADVRRGAAARGPARARVDLAVRAVPAGDGHAVFIGVQNEREWAALCAQLLGDPELAAPRFPGNPDRVAHDDELTRLIEAGLAGDDRGRGGRAAGRAGHRQRPAADGRGARRPPAAGRPGPLADRVDPRRSGADAAAAGHGGRPHAVDRPGAGARRAHRRNPGDRPAGIR